MSARARLLLAVLWLGLLLLAGWWLGSRLQLSGDLRRFMPDPETPAQKLLIDELGEGPGSRLLLVALSGDAPAVLARQSRALRERLAASPAFEMVANGADTGLDAVPERLRPYRYLLTDTFDSQALDAGFLRDQFDSRVQDLGSPVAPLVEPLVGADPTLETLRLAESWQPAGAPQRLYGVWFDRAGSRALLLAQTQAPGFDPAGQQHAIDALHTAFDGVRGDSGTVMQATGPGAFAVDIGNRTRAEAGWIGTIDTIALVLLLWFAYRSWKAPLLGVLPLASAGLAGLGAVALLFDGVHGITVAFGFTLIGVVQDYPIHLFSQQRAGTSPYATARRIWPTLATGVASTCIAYLTFLASGVDGVVIAAATNTHAALIRAAVAKGVPTFCEKPVAGSIAESIAVQEAVAGSDVGSDDSLTYDWIATLGSDTIATVRALFARQGEPAEPPPRRPPHPARHHRSGSAAGSSTGRSLAVRLEENESVLLQSYRAIAGAVGEGRPITPAAEWLLDNYHLVEEQIREIRDDLPPGFYRQLPKLASGPFAGYPRVFGRL